MGLTCRWAQVGVLVSPSSPRVPAGGFWDGIAPDPLGWGRAGNQSDAIRVFLSALNWEYVVRLAFQELGGAPRVSRG